MNLSWLDEVAPLPVRPSSPVRFRQTEPLKIVVEKSSSEFNKLNGTLQEIVDRRRLLEENVHLLERQQKTNHSSIDFQTEEDSIKQKGTVSVCDRSFLSTWNIQMYCTCVYQSVPQQHCIFHYTNI